MACIMLVAISPKKGIYACFVRDFCYKELESKIRCDRGEGGGDYASEHTSTMNAYEN